ncbi:MAG TPA: protein kinase, partial [Thermomicrobiales bacterium]|nr:protein kinase [Thermomicrobiales bacterium]
EARAIARLTHPNIVRVLDFGYEDSLHYMVMDFIDAESLRARLVRARDEGMTLQAKTTLTILRQISSALAYAHDMGLVHRDVKPGNILLAKNGQAFLADFGVVKLVGNSQITSTGTLVGTPDYMAPEQSSGAVDIGPNSDQYALAVVAYEMLTARVPFQAPTPVAVMHKHMVEPPPAPRSIAPWIPEAAEQVLLRALSKHPGARFESVEEFITRLSEAFDTSSTQTFAAGAWSAQQTPTGAAAGAAGADLMPGAPYTPPQQYSSTPTSTAAGAYAGGAGTPPPGTGWPAPTQAGLPPGPAYPGDAPPMPPPGMAVANGDDSSSPSLVTGLAVVAALIALVLGYYLIVARGDDNTPGTPGPFGFGGGTATAQTDATPTEPVVVIDPDATATDETEATEVTTEPPTATPDSAPASDTPTGEALVEPTEVVDDPTEVITEETPTPGPPEGFKEVIFFAALRGEVHDSQIYVMNPDGSDQRQITFARGHSWGPRISPDGTRFFFSSVAPGEHQEHSATGGGTEGSGNHDVYIANVDGSELTKITFDVAWENGWSWSPDGEWIAFTTDQHGDWEIYLMTPTGENFTRVTNHPAADGWPSFTPDGQQIVFTSDRTGASEIFIMNVDGTNVRQLTDRPNTFDTYPYVSPDGTKIVFSSQILRANEGEIYVMNIDGSDVTRLTSTVALNYAPSWSPDGTQIVFASDRDGNHNIYVMNADGTGQTRLTTNPEEDTTPSWGYIRVEDD